jgi:uncharacterized protein (TIGR00369 family)
MSVKDMGVGIRLLKRDRGQHLNPFGGLHGGVYASAIDTAAYWAVYCELDEDAGYTTIDLKVDYLAPVSAGKMIVKGRRIRVGKTMCLAEATAFDQTDKWLAHGTQNDGRSRLLSDDSNAIDFTSAVPVPPQIHLVRLHRNETETRCSRAVS